MHNPPAVLGWSGSALLVVFSVCWTAAARGEIDSANRAIAARPAAAAPPAVNAKLAAETDPPGIHNLMRVSERIYSGSEPHGDEGFEGLAKLGVKTVVSVDGAKPKIELARKHGLNYVHIPIGYDGVPEDAEHSLARLVKEAKAPYYVHCHHGKHRGPSAAAVACVASGELENKEALEILVRAGTSEDYPGLWRDVDNYTPPPSGTKLPELVEIAEVGSFAAAMAQVDRAYDNLKLCRDAKWSVPPDHPDIVAAQESLLLQEGLHEAGRNLANGEYEEQFKTWLKQAESMAIELRGDLKAANVSSATNRLTALENSCKQCHRVYRDQ
jgi:protein tyrosine phosphatase (PTP) superfamily phosphohydrolase (DUF442 family)